MRPSRAFFALSMTLALPVFFGTGCSSGEADPAASVCPVQTKRPSSDESPFATFANPGGRAVGEVCAFDNQCATNRCSGDAIAGTCGQCVTIRALGQSCTGALESCSTSAVCHDGICKSLRKVEGEECRLGAKGYDYEECDVQFYCARTRGYGENGTCTRYAALGECCGDERNVCTFGTTCNSDKHQCELPPPGDCLYGYYCSGETICGDDNRCHPGTLPEGARCGIVNGEFVDNACSPGFVCGNLGYPNGGTNETTCVPLPVEGETCLNGHCANGLFCWRSPETDQITQCQLPRKEGEACDVFTYYQVPCATGLECLGNTCRTACQ